MCALVVTSAFLPAMVAPANSASPVCVQDDASRQVCVHSIPQRVISLAPSLTEILFDLGAGPALVGRTARCNQPAEALAIRDVGAYMNPDLERIMSLRPDLVVAPQTGLRKEVVTRLADLGIPVFVDNSNTLDAIVQAVNRLGTILGRDADAKAVVKRFQQRRQAVAERVAHHDNPVVLFVVGIRPLVVAGGKSFVGSLIREAGGVNVAENAPTPYPRWNMEEVIRHDPDFIIVLNKECGGQDCFDLWQEHQELKAVRKKQIYQLDADLMARPCPRTMDALEQLAATIHPEIFGTASSMSLGEKK
jgi:iron complex transport system substrate-binding protein